MGELRPVTSTLAPAVASLAAAATSAATTRPPLDAFARRNLKIVHVLRAPLGGLFRHVLDLAHGQAERGHRVGLVVDSLTGGERAEAVLAELAPRLALGCVRVAIPRHLNRQDLHAWRFVSRHIAATAPDVLHGHGAKGAALARLVRGAPGAIRVYTPHGGSLVYAPGTLGGRFYRALERLLTPRTDLFLFESSYIADLFRSLVGTPQAMIRVVRNGVGDNDFHPIAQRSDATDIVSVGELRAVKAIDVLIDAVAALRQSGRRVTATIAGDGPQAADFRARSQRLGLDDQIRFVGHQPAREAFAMGRLLVVPSRAESLPYIILEAAAAGVPIITTAVGGVPEIFGPMSRDLIPADDVAALVAAIAAALDDPARIATVAQAVKARIRSEFSVGTMVDGGLTAYREAIAMRKIAQFT